MRYTAPEKLEIIKLVERSSLSVRRTLAPLGIPRSRFYGWYRRYAEGGVEALADRPPRPQRAWHRIPPERASAIDRPGPVQTGAVAPGTGGQIHRYVHRYYVSESTVYRLLKAQDLIVSPAFIVLQAVGPVPTSDHPGESIVANRFYVLESHRLGLVLPVHGA